MMIKNIDVLGLNPPKSLQLTIDYWAFQEIQLLENPIPTSCHEKSGSLLLLLYFPKMVNWISSKLLGVFLTTWPQDFLKLFRLKEKKLIQLLEDFQYFIFYLICKKCTCLSFAVEFSKSSQMKVEYKMKE